MWGLECKPPIHWVRIITYTHWGATIEQSTYCGGFWTDMTGGFAGQNDTCTSQARVWHQENRLWHEMCVSSMLLLLPSTCVRIPIGFRLNVRIFSAFSDLHRCRHRIMSVCVCVCRGDLNTARFKKTKKTNKPKPVKNTGHRFPLFSLKYESSGEISFVCRFTRRSAQSC